MGRIRSDIHSLLNSLTSLYVTDAFPWPDYHSSAPSSTTLVLHFLLLQSVRRRATIAIVLDLRHPEQFQIWFAWIERCLQRNGAPEHKVTHEEQHEQLAPILASLLPLPRLLAAGTAHPLKYPPSRFRQPPGLSKTYWLIFPPLSAHSRPGLVGKGEGRSAPTWS
jgi:hypothetical protein